MIKISEIFGPAGYYNFNKGIGSDLEPEFIERWGVTQGEGIFVGVRSVFIRTFSCSLTCPSFGLDHGQKTDEPQTIAKSLHLYTNIGELPAAKYGCDSYFSVYPQFKNMSPKLDVKEIAEMALKTAGGTFFDNPASPIHLILTGGEPMMPGWQKQFNALIDAIQELDPNQGRLQVTVETNGTQMLIDPNLMPSVDLTWSVSPKLTVSGHTYEEAIKPEVVDSYLDRSRNLYLKYVVQSMADFDEVDEVTKMFEEACGSRLKVFIMAEGGTESEYTKHSTVELVGEAVKRGYNISPRLQVMIGANVTGW